VAAIRQVASVMTTDPLDVANYIDHELGRQIADWPLNEALIAVEAVYTAAARRLRSLQRQKAQS
jgi:hypothetical protein